MTIPRIDFIHIGFHKTASTFLQSVIFPNTKDLFILNYIDPDIEKWFFENFVKIDANSFSKNIFLNQFNEQLQKFSIISNERMRFAISEENLSGDIYTGLEARELMNRIKHVFGSTTILIVIRNQLDFILSAYGNYVIHGGILSLKKWLISEETRFGKILEKVIYSPFILNYQKTFGTDRIRVIQYEKLFDDNCGISSFLSKFEIHENHFEHKIVNSGRSLLSNNFLTILNRVGLENLRGRHHFVKKFGNRKNDRNKLRSILQDKFLDFIEDNKKLEKILHMQLDKKYFE